MNVKYLMGKADSIVRETVTVEEYSFISSGFKSRFLEIAISQAIKFYASFFNIESQIFSASDFNKEYEIVYKNALDLGLFKKGGIREKDHLNLWVLSKVYQPSLYVESGIYIGSSLHAFLINNPSKVIGIDPNLKFFKINSEKYSNLSLVSEKDFSELQIDDIPDKNLAYFDDHINAAARIIQASKKGLKYLLFDDATGLEGICQRKYPAYPTVPMVMHYKSLAINDELHWTFSITKKIKQKGFLNKLKGTFREEIMIEKLKISITENIIAQCKEASSKILRVSRIPDLGEYIIQSKPEKMVDTSKYLIELK